MYNVKRCLVILLILYSCVGCANTTMQETVESWNTKTKTVISEYDEVKATSEPLLQDFINLYAYNYASDEVLPYFDCDFAEKCKTGIEKDDYDKHFVSEMSNLGLSMTDYARGLSDGTINDYDYIVTSVVLHNYFTSISSSGVTEIYVMQCDNLELTVIVTWQDNKIVDVIRFV